VQRGTAVTYTTHPKLDHNGRGVTGWDETERCARTGTCRGRYSLPAVLDIVRFDRATDYLFRDSSKSGTRHSDVADHLQIPRVMSPTVCICYICWDSKGLSRLKLSSCLPQVRLTITDYGKGFYISKKKNSNDKGGLGLIGLRERAGLENKMRPLIGHRILYPDGTMNSYVQRYLREKVINIFKRKTRIFTKTNE